MSSSKKIDPTETYVLEETAITKVTSLEDLAELAARQDKRSGYDRHVVGDRSKYEAPVRHKAPRRS